MSDEKKLLFESIYKSDFPLFRRRYSEFKGDVNVREYDDIGHTFLTLCCENNLLEFVKLLLEDQRVDVNIDPLHYACKGNHVDVVQELLLHPRIKVQDHHFTTATIAKSEKIKTLLENYKKHHVGRSYSENRSCFGNSPTGGEVKRLEEEHHKEEDVEEEEEEEDGGMIEVSVEYIQNLTVQFQTLNEDRGRLFEENQEVKLEMEKMKEEHEKMKKEKMNEKCKLLDEKIRTKELREAVTTVTNKLEQYEAEILSLHAFKQEQEEQLEAREAEILSLQTALQQELKMSKEKEEPKATLSSFLKKLEMSSYYEKMNSGGVKYEDLEIFLEQPKATEEYIPSLFQRVKFLKAIKKLKQEKDIISGEYFWNGKSLLIKRNFAFFENGRYEFEKLTSNVYKIKIRDDTFVFIWDEEDEMLRVVKTKGDYAFINRISNEGSGYLGGRDQILGKYDWNGKTLDLKKNHCFFEQKRYSYEKVASTVYTVQIEKKKFVFNWYKEDCVLGVVEVEGDSFFERIDHKVYTKTLNNDHQQIHPHEQYLSKKEEEEKKIKSRLDTKLRELEEEEFWKYEPTKYFSVHGKLDFHINIAKDYSKFICRFKPEQSKFHNAEDYEDMKIACSLFENVVVDLEEDEVLSEFVKEMEEEYQDSVKEEMTKKVENVTEEMEGLLKDIIEDVFHFFMPSRDVDMEELLKNVGSEKYCEVVDEGIRSAQKKREEDGKGKNNVFLGEMKGKYGYCRHQATLLKLICDTLGIRCKLEVIFNFNAWNTIQVKDRLFFVDVTNHGNKLFDIEQYYKVLEGIVQGGDESGDTESTQKSMNELLRKKKREEELLGRLIRYSKKELRDEFEADLSGRGGSGDVALFKILKNVWYSDHKKEEDEGEEEEEEEEEMEKKVEEGAKKDPGLMFSKGEMIAMKKIKVRNDEEMEDLGIPKRYAVREASHMKVLDHPSIIDVMGHWEDNQVNCVYIAMRAMDMDGRRLLETLIRDDDLPRTRKQIEVLIFLLETARGMRYLESLDITHLDMKLENVMVRWDSKTKQITDVRIIDFGGAKNNCVHSSSFWMNTEGYDAPEIRDLKRIKEIQNEMPTLNKLMEKRRPPKRKVQECLNKIVLKFNEIKRNFRGLDEHFEVVTKTIDSLRLGNRVAWNRETVQRRIEVFKILNDDLEEDDGSQSSNVSDFDCRSDIYSFGVMMGEFMVGKLIPSELMGLRDKCLMEDRRDRPSCDEVVHQVKKLLSFFNEKMKEN